MQLSFLVGGCIHHHPSTSRSTAKLRLQSFPRGLGKGSDAAVVGAWLESVLDNLALEQVPVTSPKQFFGG